MRTLIVTVGLPRSGKTTWARAQGHPIVNPDAIRLGLHGHRFIVDAEPFVWAIAKVMVRALFRAGHDTVILDATNTTKKRRDEWMTTGEWWTRFHVVPTSKEECLARATAERDEEIKPIIEKMAATFEPLDPVYTDPRYSGWIYADPKPDYEALYFDLLFQVAFVHKGESRHETAKRYIRQSEESHGPAMSTNAVDPQNRKTHV